MNVACQRGLFGQKDNLIICCCFPRHLYGSTDLTLDSKICKIQNMCVTQGKAFSCPANPDKNANRGRDYTRLSSYKVDTLNKN